MTECWEPGGCSSPPRDSQSSACPTTRTSQTTGRTAHPFRRQGRRQPEALPLAEGKVMRWGGSVRLRCHRTCKGWCVCVREGMCTCTRGHLGWHQRAWLSEAGEAGLHGALGQDSSRSSGEPRLPSHHPHQFSDLPYRFRLPCPHMCCVHGAWGTCNPSVSTALSPTEAQCPGATEPWPLEGAPWRTLVRRD